MKKIYYFIIALLLFCISSLQAQTTQGTEFWLTFGKDRLNATTVPYTMQIRIVAGSQPTTATIYFTNLNDSVQLNLSAYEVYTYSLDSIQKVAMYNFEMGTTNYSARITTTELASVYAFLYLNNSNMDATNLFPVTALGTEYHHCSYTQHVQNFMDAYAVVATQNNTHLYHNGDSVATLNAGHVYYRTSSDMTGSLITANNPVAFFALHQGAQIPAGSPSQIFLMQQLAPVRTWDRTFFVPVTIEEQEIVRIVVSQNGTYIEQTGGTIRTGVPGAQTILSGLQKGEFVELDIGFYGCYIYANNPVGVCSYLKSTYPPNASMPSQVWVPGIKQAASSIRMSIFNISPSYSMTQQALIVTPTATRGDTKVFIGENLPVSLSGVIWNEHISGYSFYNMPLINDTTAYLFSNQQGIIVFGYGVGENTLSASYYYLAGSAMRDLDAAFYANDVHFQDLEDNPFCENTVTFQAAIENMGVEMDSIKWFINGIQEPLGYKQLEWTKTTFLIGEYEITMWVRFDNDSIISKTGTLKIMNCNMSAEFYVNNVHHANLQDTVFCNKEVHFLAESENYTEIKWYIDGVWHQPANPLDWYKSFETGNYEIKMVAFLSNGEPVTLVATLRMEVFWIKMRNVRY